MFAGLWEWAKRFLVNLCYTERWKTSSGPRLFFVQQWRKTGRKERQSVQYVTHFYFNSLKSFDSLMFVCDYNHAKTVWINIAIFTTTVLRIFNKRIRARAVMRNTTTGAKCAILIENPVRILWICCAVSRAVSKSMKCAV